MSNENPFFLSKVECPICKTINEFETVKVGAYFENGRDTDFCPKDITWRFARYEGYNPLAFFTASCSNCFYTREYTTSFKEWKNDNNFRMYRLKTVKEKHLDQLARADSVLKQMGEAIDINRHPNESAILKLNLAIFDEQLNDRPSNLDLGRLYLRIGWVFRDLERGENPSVKLLKGLMLEIDQRHGAFRDQLEKTGATLAAFARHVQSHFETKELSTEVKSRMDPFRDKFETRLAAFKTELDATSDKIADLNSLMHEYKSAALGGEIGSDGVAFGKYGSFVEFLMAVRRSWDGIVTNEKESIERAVLYYKKAFSGGRDISPGNQQLQASYLIAELSRRIGQYDEARQYFNSTIKYGQEFIYQNRKDPSRTALARKILELAIEQGKMNMEALKSA